MPQVRQALVLHGDQRTVATEALASMCKECELHRKKYTINLKNTQRVARVFSLVSFWAVYELILCLTTVSQPFNDLSGKCLLIFCIFPVLQNFNILGFGLLVEKN